MARRPFFGSSGAAPTARMDMRVATAPGRAYGDLFQNLGRLGGALLKDYGDTKKQRQEDEGTIKKISGALDLLSSRDSGKKQLYEAMKSRINDPEVGLTQRVSEATGLLDTISLTQNISNEQELMSLRKDRASQEKELNDLRSNAQLIDNLRNKLKLGQEIEEEDLLPTSVRIARQEEERQIKLDAQIENYKASQLNRANAQFRLRQLEDNQDLDRETKEVELEKARKALELSDIELNTARRQYDRISGLDTRFDLSDKVVPDPNDEIFQLLATMDLNTALQGDFGGMVMRTLSAPQKFFFGDTLAKATEAEGQKINTIDYLLREPLLKRLSSRPTNLTNEKVNEILPKKNENPTDGKKKIRESLLPALRSQLTEAKRTLLSTAESEKTYIEDAEKAAIQLPNIIKGLEIALIDDRDERRSAFSAFFEADTTTQPTVDATTMGTTRLGVKYEVLTD